MNRAILAMLCLWALSCGKRAPLTTVTPMGPPSFWVWHRSSDLSAAELDSLKIAGTRRLYWHAVECEWKGGDWQAVRIAKPMQPIAGIQIIPVFRIKPNPEFLASPAAVKSFRLLFERWADENSFDELQLDFDCPDRMLDGYGKFLQNLGGEIEPVRISITALAGWPRHPGFEKLARSVSAMAPMFYDLFPDSPGDVMKRKFQALADVKSKELIHEWAKCPVPWLAGLPNFERISVFTGDGKLSGHLRGWSQDGLFFNPSLQPVPLENGVTFYQLDKPVTLYGTSIAVGSSVVHRMPEPAVLAALAQAAKEAGAAGLVYFTLPGPGIQAAFSAGHLAGKSISTLSLTAYRDGSVVLKNEGPGDLPSNPLRWNLVMEADHAGTFRSAAPGDFASTLSEGPAELVTRIVLQFSKLPAGGSISSGRLIVLPGAVRWSVPGTEENPRSLEIQ